MNLNDAVVKATSPEVDLGTKWETAGLVELRVKRSMTRTVGVSRYLSPREFRVLKETANTHLWSLIDSVLEEL